MDIFKLLVCIAAVVAWLILGGKFFYRGIKDGHLPFILLGSFLIASSALVAALLSLELGF